MWISDEYYEELLRVINQCSQGSFDFDEQKLKDFDSAKYEKLTNALVGLKSHFKKHILKTIEALHAIIEGNYDIVKDNDIVQNDYHIVYRKYNMLITHLNKIHNEVKRIEKLIIEGGKVNSRIDTFSFNGKWFDYVSSLNCILYALSTPFDEVSDVVNNIAKGNLTKKMSSNINGFEVKGEFLRLAMTINTMIDQLAQFASEVTRVVKEVGTDGVLGGQARVDGVSGIWLDLTNNVNGMANSITAQVRNVAEVTTAVARGDLSQKITVDAKGEILELKGTINTMIDQLAQFASEVTRVAKEVGTDGVLGGQARVDGVSGTWLDLTNNVNGMANSLIAQVRNIADVTTAVASGDLTRKIDIGVKGELLELKNNINTMIDGLSESDTKNKHQNWVKDGVALLNKKVLEEDNFLEQAQTAITELARYVNAGMGALYIYHPDEKTLSLEGRYACVEKEDFAASFQVGEGIVGQVAYEKKPILLRNVVDAARIRTATTEFFPLSIYTAPLVFKDELIGVVELAAHEFFDELHMEYFNRAFSILPASLYASLQSHATKELLVQSQAQSEELKEQSLMLNNQKMELERKNKDLKEARIEISRAKEIEMANKYKSEFLANMSHELRTPLNSILLLSNSLSNSHDIDLEKIHKQASIIYNAGNGLLELINDVLDLSKIEANLVSLNVEEIKVATLVDELHQLFIPQAENKKIELNFSVSEHVFENLVTDKIKISQILKNFISNAIKFTGENGKVEIRFERNDEADKDRLPLRISVTDNGIGIEEDKINLVFEPFRQADGSTSRKYGGTGLGLSISKEFAGLLGGRIGVKSEVGNGSVFAVYLPQRLDTEGMDSRLVERVRQGDEKKKTSHISIAQEQIRAEANTLPGSVSSSVPEEMAGDGIVILVADDDSMFCSIIKDMISKLGYKVMFAYDGSTALSLAREYQPKAILLDLVLPGTDGIDVLKVLKADFDTRHIPVKVISFNDVNSDIKKMGALDFLRKPISENVLNNTLVSLVNFASIEKKYILSIEDKKGELAHLLSDKNVEVFSVDNMEEALKKIAENKEVDLVIFDAGLCGGDVSDSIMMLRDCRKDLRFVIYDPLKNIDKDMLRNCGNNVVLKVATDNGKLVEYVSLFLHIKKELLDKEKQELLNDAMMKDTQLNHKKVLIVDDDIINIFSLSSVLEEKNIEIITTRVCSAHCRYVRPTCGHKSPLRPW